MPKIILTMIAVAALISTVNCHAQAQLLSPKNVERLNRMSGGKERILKYHKLFRRDSLKRERILRRKFKNAVDSAFKAGSGIHQVPVTDWLESPEEHSEKLLPASDSDAHRDEDGLPASLDSIRQKLKLLSDFDTARNFNLPDSIPLKSSFQPDFNALKDELDIGQRYAVQGILGVVNVSADQFQLNDAQTVDIPDVDIPSSLNMLPTNSTQVQQTDVSDAATNKYGQFSDELIEEIQDRLSGAQQRIGKMLSRYQSFTSFQDSTFGIRRTSLKGRPLKERLFVGCNIVPQTVNPFGLDLAPQLGYKITTKFIIGAGVNYRMSFTDTLSRQDIRVSGELSYSVFTSVTLWRSWYGFGEVERSATDHHDEFHRRPRRLEGVAGIGRRFLIHPKVYFNVTLVYRVLDTEEIPGDGKLQCRIGISLSELALRRKTITYNPNY